MYVATFAGSGGNYCTVQALAIDHIDFDLAELSVSEALVSQQTNLVT